MSGSGKTDAIAGALLLGVAAVYYQATLGLQVSSLSDSVGPDGLPRLLAAGLALVALSLIGKGLWLARKAAPTVEAEPGGEEPAAKLPRALGFLAIGIGYMLVAPWTGYAIALALVIMAVALYEGAVPGLRLVLVAVGGGVGFWLVFVRLLGVEQPVSRLLG